MIDEEKQRKALETIQNLISEARMMAFNTKADQKLFDLLDNMELFPGLMLEPENCTEFFESHLSKLCDEHSFERIKMMYFNG